MNFDEFNLHPSVMEGVQTMGFQQATPIQEQAIPLILKGSDLIGCAQTGTGKTAAFVLPILSMLAEQNSSNLQIKALIIVPTRELALQIDQSVEGFSYFSSVGSIAVYGGSDGGSWDKQRAAITNGADIVVATPGRLFQHLQMGYVDLSHVKYLILDEADRMLDMGFYDDIMEIIKLLPDKRQTMMFSATMPPKIRELAKKILSSPAEISLAVSKPADNILQMAYIVNESQKLELLCSLIVGKEEVKSAILFVSKKSEVRSITQQLVRNGVDARAMFSDIEQREREEVMRDFRNRKFQIIVATDIISRGIDIEDIDLVVNYDIPKDPEDYVHRIGRTARAHSDGVAITFVSPDKKYDLQKIERFLEAKIHTQTFGKVSESAGGERSQRRDSDKRQRSKRSDNRHERKSPRKPEANGQSATASSQPKRKKHHRPKPKSQENK